MRWRRRLVKRFRWPATLVAAGALLLEAVNTVADVELMRTPALVVGIDHGAVRVRIGESFGDTLPTWQGPSVTLRSYHEALPWLLPFRDDWGPFTEYSLPLWIPLLLCGVPAGCSWRRVILKRRWQRAGLCPECGYDRRGLAADAKCPECGTVPEAG
jgi:hypothetical protein